MVLVDRSDEARMAQAAAIRVVTGAVGAGLSIAFACPAVGAAGIGAVVGGAYGSRLWSFVAAGVLLACALAIAASFVVPHDVPRWAMIAFGAVGLAAVAAAALARLPQAFSGVGGASAGFLVLLVAGVPMLVRPATWICIAATIAIFTFLVLDRLRLRARAA
ncbi:MAG TPA: hypothetical protein VIS77_00780 [Burkholderiales bacterium]